MNNDSLKKFLKVTFIVIGVCCTVAAVSVLLYNLFKKHFKITFDSADVSNKEDDDDIFDDSDNFQPTFSSEIEEPEAE